MYILQVHRQNCELLIFATLNHSCVRNIILTPVLLA